MSKYRNVIDTFLPVPIEVCLDLMLVETENEDGSKSGTFAAGGFHTQHLTAEVGTGDDASTLEVWSGAGYGNPYLGVSGPGGVVRIDARELVKTIVAEYPFLLSADAAKPADPQCSVAGLAADMGEASAKCPHCGTADGLGYSARHGICVECDERNDGEVLNGKNPSGDERLLAALDQIADFPNDGVRTNREKVEAMRRIAKEARS